MNEKKCLHCQNIIGVEDLNIKSMSETTYNARNILDSSWGKFLQMLDRYIDSNKIDTQENTNAMPDNLQQGTDIQ
jgi:transposase